MASVQRFVVGVLGLIARDDGRVLALRRAVPSPDTGALWETVAGKVEAGEDPLRAVEREIWEETGLVASAEPRPLDAWVALYQGQPLLLIAYRASLGGGEVRLSREHDASAWVTPEEFARRSPHARVAQLLHLRADACRAGGA